MRLIYLIGFLTLTFLLQTVSAQEMYGQAPCEALTSGQFDFVEDIEFIPTCETGYDCMSEKYFSCEMEVASKIIETCPDNDFFCQNLNLLNMVGVLIDDDLYGTVYNYYTGQSRDNFPQVIEAVRNSDFEAALALLPETDCTEFCHPLLPYSRALIYELINQPGKALNEYDLALSYVPHHLITHYRRGLLLGRMGRSTEASFETQWLSDYFTAFAPALLPAIVPLVETYPLDTTRLEDWVRYPVMFSSLNIGGYFFQDLTQSEAYPVKIAFYPDLQLLLSIDLFRSFYPNSTGDIFNTYLLQETVKNQFDFVLSEGGGFFNAMSLSFQGSIVFGHEGFGAGEGGGGEQLYILAPTNTPDPRSIFGEPICEGGVISRLRAGMFVPVGISHSGLEYSNTAGAEPLKDDFLHDPILVRENPVCIGDVLWWQLEDTDGKLGWHAENEGNTYLLNPYGNYSQDFLYCPTALAPHLFSGRDAQVIAGMGANNLRAEASSSSELLEQIPPETVFFVSDGPVCSEGMLWWWVRYNDVFGWTPEGTGEIYWLEPMVSP